MTEWFDDSNEADLLTVCPVHLRFVPCRRCRRGEERYSVDPATVRLAFRYQQGLDAEWLDVRPVEE